MYVPRTSSTALIVCRASAAVRRFQIPNPDFHPPSAGRSLPGNQMGINSSSDEEEEEEEEEEGEDCTHSEFLPPEDDRVPCWKCSKFLLPDKAIAHGKACKGDTVQFEDFVDPVISPSSLSTGLKFMTHHECPHGPPPKKAKLGTTTSCDGVIMVSPWSDLIVISRKTQGMVLDLFFPEMKACYSSGFLHHVVDGERPHKHLKEEDIRRLFRTAMGDPMKRSTIVAMARRNSSLPIHWDYLAAAINEEIQPYDVIAEAVFVNTVRLNFMGFDALAGSIGETLNCSESYPAILKFKRSNDEEEDLCRSSPGRSWNVGEWGECLDLTGTIEAIRGSRTTRLFWENIFGVLGNLDQLRHLRLDDNGIGDPECLRIAKLMEGGQLERLSLRLNNITDVGAQSLAGGLQGRHCRVEVLDLCSNSSMCYIGTEGWKAIKKALCARTTISATSKSNHTLASLVYTPPGILEVGIPKEGIYGIPDEVAMALNALLHINGNVDISPAKEKVWGVHFSNVRAAHFSREPGEADRNRTGMQELFDIIDDKHDDNSSKVKLAPHILTVFNKAGDGRVVRVYNPSLSNLFGVVRALSPELFGRPSMERERLEASWRRV